MDRIEAIANERHLDYVLDGRFARDRPVRERRSTPTARTPSAPLDPGLCFFFDVSPPDITHSST
jgi:hypothetical protein